MRQNGTHQLRDIRLVTLDLDDTLWPVRAVIERAETRLHDWLKMHCPATAARFSPACLRTLRHEAEREQPELRGNFVATRLASIRLALRRAGDRENCAEAAFAAFWSARHEIDYFDDVLPALERLRSHFILGAITNGNSDPQLLEVKRYFSFSLSATEAGCHKPAREIFRLACRRANVSPANALHAGDDIDLDVRGALAVGMHAAWINRDMRCLRMLAPPAITVPDLKALADHLGV